MAKSNDLMEKIISLCKRRGFVYPSSEIYGGFANIYDFGPLGSLLAKNIRDTWIKKIIQERDDMYLIDGSILMHPKAWEASGHTAAFTDPLIQCPLCKKRFRADKLEGWELEKDNKTGKQLDGIMERVRTLPPRFETVNEGMEAQSQSAGQISETMNHLNIITQNTLEALREFNLAAEYLREAAQDLQDEVSRFKVN